MSNDKENLFKFTSSTLEGLHEKLAQFQISKQKRFLSLSIHKENSTWFCFALTNPSEVTIVSRDGNAAKVDFSGDLHVNPGGGYS